MRVYIFWCALAVSVVRHQASLAAPPAAPRAPAFEARFFESGQLRIRLNDPVCALETRYGALQIPWAEVERVEFGLRVPPEIAKRLEQAAQELGDADFQTREKATAELHAAQERAIAPLRQAATSSDAERAHRARKLLESLRETLGERWETLRDEDLVQTADSRIAGRISATALSVVTGPFGAQTTPLSELRSLTRVGLENDEPLPTNIQENPGSLWNYQERVGQIFYFRVTGAASGPLWGTDLYTLDSALAAAAVHAGALKAGQAGVVRVQILGAQGQFTGSARNGVQSWDWAGFPAAFNVKATRATR